MYIFFCLQVRFNLTETYNDVVNFFPCFYLPLDYSRECFWPTGKDEEECNRILDRLYRMFEQKGKIFYSRFKNYPACFKALSVSDCENVEKLKKLFGEYGIKPFWFSLGLIKIYEKEEQWNKVVEFAELALRDIAETKSGAIWIEYLQSKIQNGTDHCRHGVNR